MNYTEQCRWGIMLLILIFCTCVRAQNATNDATEAPRRITVLTQSYGDSVRIRWAPSDFAVWEASRAEGVNLVRQTVMRNGVMLPLAERRVRKILSGTPFKPAPIEAFEQAGATDKYVGIGGQAIYGESFIPDGSSQDEDYVASMITAAAERDNRYGFGMFSADQSWRAAHLMGLAYTDTDVKRGDVYVYRIVPVKAISGLDTIGSGFSSQEVNLAAPPPKVVNLTANFESYRATLTWDLNHSSYFYTAYYVERSTDGINYETLNETAFVPIGDPDRPVALYQDSLPYNGRPYFYRIIGRTPFGLDGPPSDAVQGMGLDEETIAAPSIAAVMEYEADVFEVRWNYEDDPSVLGFELLRSATNQGVYEPISAMLPPDARTYSDESPLPANYYKVRVTDTLQRTKLSFPIMAQLSDSIPPAKPRGLRGVILTNGEVVLSWENNTEADLLGYRVWISNTEEAEYTLMTEAPTPDNFYVGKTTLNTLTKKMYCKLTALDVRHNPSEFTDAYVLLRPDTIPPSPPVLTSIDRSTDSVVLHFFQSQDVDLASNDIERQLVGDTTWQLVTSLVAPQQLAVTRFAEGGLPPGAEYRYRITAVDLAGLRTFSVALAGGILDDYIRPGVARVATSVDRREQLVELRWEYEAEGSDFSHFDVYRAKAGEAPRSIGRLSGADAGAKRGRKKAKVFSYTDRQNLTRDTDYVYHVRAVYRSGAMSRLSEAVDVNF